MKYIKISIVILLVSFISIFAYKLTTNNSNNKLSLTKEQMKEMLSYTIDGNSTSSMPTKGSGYKVKSITCKNGSILSWDNDNWLLEVEKLESEDLCNIDFTTGTGSYIVTAVPSIAGSLDSTSKTTTENGQVTFYTDLVIDSVSGCTNEISDGKVIVKNVTGNTTCNINVSYMKLYDKLLADKSTRLTRTDFSTVLTTDNTNTLYTSTEDSKTVYYFAGNATDNWVKFGGFYWRIIRTNSDGGVRLLYHGTSTTATDAYIGTSKFNSSSDNIAYVSYMYGSTGSIPNARTNQTNPSTIKGVIDTWYAKNMSSYTKYLSTTAVYCNDRSTPGNTYFGAYTRLYINKTPTYDCTATEDKFTVDSSTGNGKLTYPIVLMTADEVSFAGGVYQQKALTWYYYNSANGSSTGSLWWWLMSPYFWNGSNADVFFVHGSNGPGYLLNSYVGGTGTVRPVISLKEDILYKLGDGSAESPYEIQETPDTISDVVKANAVNENGYRYEGTDPNNYIQMQKTDGTTEMWRIIGLFPDGENGEDVIRVRKAEYEEVIYDNGEHNVAYIYKNTAENKNNLLAYNDSILNKNYLAAPMDVCSNCVNYWPKTALYSSWSKIYNITNYKNTVNYKIYLGTTSEYKVITVSEWYLAERGTTAGATAKSSYSSATTFTGSVGLIYPSDYGYGVLASDCERTVISYNYNGTASCYNKNWLYQGNSDAQWLISPGVTSAYYTFQIQSNGITFLNSILESDNFSNGVSSGLASPVMALKSDVVVTGSGTQTDPYIMK